MSNCVLVDTFPAFLSFWKNMRSRDIREQIAGWRSVYLSEWPELFQKQIQCYAEEGEDWELIAQERIFPALPERLPRMQTARDNLVKVCQQVYETSRTKLGFEKPVVFVIYVGIGCGAGWATTYRDSLAVLLGLENIAEEGWQTLSSLQGLLAHEIGHLVHRTWRAESSLPDGDGSCWQLYLEGFAQWCEQLVTGGPWHIAPIDSGWLDWCRSHRNRLAQEYMRCLEKKESTRRFFGSWYDIQGYKQAGYYLGFELIRALESKIPIKEVASLVDIDASVKIELERMASS